MIYPNVLLEQRPPKESLVDEVNSLTNASGELNEEVLTHILSTVTKLNDNMYLKSFELLGETESANVYMLFGLVQLFKRNYWSAIYHMGVGFDRSAKGDFEKINSVYKVLVTRAFDKAGIKVENQSITHALIKETHYFNSLTVTPDSLSAEEVVRYFELCWTLNEIVDSYSQEVGNEQSPRKTLIYAQAKLQLLQPNKAIEILNELLASQNTSTGTNLKTELDAKLLLVDSYTLCGTQSKYVDTLLEIPMGLFLETPEKLGEVHRMLMNVGDTNMVKKFTDEAYSFLKTNASSKLKFRGEFGSLNSNFRIRQKLARFRNVPPILISTISKSGSTLLPSLLIRKVAMPRVNVFCENVITEGSWYDLALNEGAMKEFAKGGALCRQHFAPTNHIMDNIQKYGIDRLVFHIRDPRDCLLSWVFYKEAQLRKSLHPSPLVRLIEPAHFAKLNFEEKVDFYIDTFYCQTLGLMKEWFDAKEQLAGSIEVKITTFEDMVKDKVAFLDDLLQFYQIKGSRVSDFMISQALKFRSKPVLTKKREGKRRGWKELFTSKQIEKVNDLMPNSVRELYL